MKVLVACEYSGRVRDAFIAKGHDAISCDLLNTERPGPHYKGNVFDIIKGGFDLLIAFPPCTYICYSGLHWNTKRPKRQIETDAGIDFVKRLWSSNIPRVCLENPLGLLSQMRRPNQIVQPYWFGHAEMKSTCLWLRNLPNLKPTSMVKIPESGRWLNKTKTGQDALICIRDSGERAKLRSLTYTGLAAAMAKQWGNLEPMPHPNRNKVYQFGPTEWNSVL